MKLTKFFADEWSSTELGVAMPAFQDPETYRDILDSLQIGVSVIDLQKKLFSGAMALNSLPAMGGWTYWGIVARKTSLQPGAMRNVQ